MKTTAITINDAITDENRVSGTQERWYAGYTVARHEKRVAEHLMLRGIEHFLPLYETVHHWNNGRHRVQLPLFPGYLFVRIALEERLRVLEAPGFVRLVGFNGRACALPEFEILRMREALTRGVLAEPHPYLTVGTRVEVRNGPLSGLTGILLRRQNKHRVVLSIDLIMRSIVVEVAAEDVQVMKQVQTLGNSALECNGRRH